MKITKSKLKQIIKEELESVVEEQSKALSVDLYKHYRELGLTDKAVMTLEMGRLRRAMKKLKKSTMMYMDYNATLDEVVNNIDMIAAIGKELRQLSDSGLLGQKNTQLQQEK